MQLGLKSPFDSQSRIDIHPVTTEIVADFNLGADTQVHIFHTFDGVHIVPYLWFCEQNIISSVPREIILWMLPRPVLLPEIQEAIKLEPIVAEHHIPHSCELEIVNALGISRDCLVHRRK